MRVILVLVLIGVTCAVPRQPTRIVGGESANIENYPFMAGMLFYFMDLIIPHCGGTLITNTAVVSAAHCFMNDIPTMWKVRLGSNIHSSGGTVHAVSKVILHSEFNWFLIINDIAIFRLTNPAVFSDQIKSARIAGPHYTLPDNTLVHAIGFGATEWKGECSEDLQYVEVNVINHQTCIERYAYLKTQPNMSHIPNVTSEMLCVGILDVGGKATCQGDSGGPVIHNKDVLVGVISWAYQCAHPMYPGVKLRVSSYTDWIYRNSID